MAESDNYMAFCDNARAQATSTLGPAGPDAWRRGRPSPQLTYW